MKAIGESKIGLLTKQTQSFIRHSQQQLSSAPSPPEREKTFASGVRSVNG